MKLRFKITLKRGVKTIAEVSGFEVESDHLTVEDVTEKVLEIEAGVEKLTGLRCHIEQVR